MTDSNDGLGNQMPFLTAKGPYDIPLPKIQIGAPTIIVVNGDGSTSRTVCPPPKE